VALFFSRGVAAQPPCPAAAHLPQLTIDQLDNPAVPVIDEWQVLLRGVPISDAQLAALALDDVAIDLTRSEMEGRGTWVYVGMLIAAGGAIISSVGWYLYGSDQGNVPTGLSLGLALGGFVVGGGGVLLVTQSVQRPLEPHLAPTPAHRLSREEARRLVAVVNQQLFAEICRAAELPPHPPDPPAPPAAAEPAASESAPAP
jgi:hypothetical protein